MYILKNNHKFFGIFCILIAQLLFSIQDMVIKYLSSNYALHQIIFIEAIAAFLITFLILVPLEGGFNNLRTNRIKIHLLRGLGIVIVDIFFFTAISSLPLSDVVTIFFVAPLFISLLSIILLREKVFPSSWIAIIVGFIGVITMFRPGIAEFNPINLLPLIAAFSYAVVQILARKLGKKEKASTMTFYVLLHIIIVSGISGIFLGNGRFYEMSNPSTHFLFRAWQLPTFFDYFLLIGIGVIYALASYFISQAYRISHPSTIAPFEYAAVPFSIIWSILIFKDIPDIFAWIGFFLITSSGVFVVYTKSDNIGQNYLSRSISKKN